jgi:hypothetical protein
MLVILQSRFFIFMYVILVIFRRGGGGDWLGDFDDLGFIRGGFFLVFRGGGWRWKFRCGMCGIGFLWFLG